MVQVLEMMYAYPLGLSNQRVQVCSSGCFRLKSGGVWFAMLKLWTERRRIEFEVKRREADKPRCSNGTFIFMAARLYKYFHLCMREEPLKQYICSEYGTSHVISFIYLTYYCLNYLLPKVPSYIRRYVKSILLFLIIYVAIYHSRISYVLRS